MVPSDPVTALKHSLLVTYCHDVCVKVPHSILSTPQKAQGMAKPPWIIVNGPSSIPFPLLVAIYYAAFVGRVFCVPRSRGQAYEAGSRPNDSDEVSELLLLPLQCSPGHSIPATFDMIDAVRA